MKRRCFALLSWGMRTEPIPTTAKNNRLLSFSPSRLSFTLMSVSNKKIETLEIEAPTEHKASGIYTFSFTKLSKFAQKNTFFIKFALNITLFWYFG
jgi:hypothetical protein